MIKKCPVDLRDIEFLKPVFNSYLVLTPWACNIELASSSFKSEYGSAVRTLMETVSSAFNDFPSVKLVVRAELAEYFFEAFVFSLSLLHIF